MIVERRLQNKRHAAACLPLHEWRA